MGRGGIPGISPVIAYYLNNINGCYMRSHKVKELERWMVTVDHQLSGADIEPLLVWDAIIYAG